MDEFTTIKLLRSKGESIRAIARALKVSRNTVRKYLKTSEPPAYQVKSQGNNIPEDVFTIITPSKSKWDKYKNEIADMYYNKKFIGSRIFNELKQKGVEGSLTGFYIFFRKIKNQDIAKRVRARFETGPGKQSQFDWSDYIVKIDGELRKIYVYQTILCFSRYKHHIGSYNKNQGSIFEAIEKAFEKFGGTPEEILTDNAKQMVSNSNPKNFEYNQQYINFLNYYGVTPRVCKIRHSWTKGKVENPFRYLEEHFIKGNEFSSLDDFNEKLNEFTDKWNRQHHEGVNDIPYQRYTVEKEYLKPLPAGKYIGREIIWCKVNNVNNTSYLRAKFIEYFSDIENYLENISAQKRLNWKRHVTKILSLTEIYKIEDIKKALQSSLNHNVYSYDYVLAFMRENFDINYQEYTKSYEIPKNNQLELELKDIKRSLQEYEEVGNGKI